MVMNFDPNHSTAVSVVFNGGFDGQALGSFPLTHLQLAEFIYQEISKVADAESRENLQILTALGKMPAESMAGVLAQVPNQADRPLAAIILLECGADALGALLKRMWLEQHHAFFMHVFSSNNKRLMITELSGEVVFTPLLHYVPYKTLLAALSNQDHLDHFSDILREDDIKSILDGNALSFDQKRNFLTYIYDGDKNVFYHCDGDSVGKDYLLGHDRIELIRGEPKFFDRFNADFIARELERCAPGWNPDPQQAVWNPDQARIVLGSVCNDEASGESFFLARIPSDKVADILGALFGDFTVNQIKAIFTQPVQVGEKSLAEKFVALPDQHPGRTVWKYINTAYNIMPKVSDAAVQAAVAQGAGKPGNTGK